MKKMRNLFIIILIGIIAVFAEERVDALACQYNGYFDKDTTKNIYSVLNRTGRGLEYQVVLHVVDGTVVIDSFKAREKRDESVYDESMHDFIDTYNSDGWSNFEDLGSTKKIVDSADVKKLIVDSVSKGSCPSLKMYYGQNSHTAYLYSEEKQCDDFLYKCPRQNFVVSNPTIIKDKDEMTSCSPGVLEDFKKRIDTEIKNELENEFSDIVTKINAIDPQWAAMARQEKIREYANKYDVAAVSRIEDAKAIALSYNCIEVSDYVAQITAKPNGELQKLITDYSTKISGAIGDAYVNAIKVCGNDKKCVDYNEGAAGETLKDIEELNSNLTIKLEELKGAYFEGIPENTCVGILGDVSDLVQGAFDIIKIAAPILLIFFGTLDFGKAALAGDDKATKQATTDFMKRVAAAIAIFFLPWFIELIFSLPGLEELSLDNVICGISKVVFKR